MFRISEAIFSNFSIDFPVNVRLSVGADRKIYVVNETSSSSQIAKGKF
jgi:hypothetical protein